MVHLKLIIMKKLFTGLGLLAAIPSVAQSDHPNIILFLVDDMGLMDTSVPFITDESGVPFRYPLNEWYRTPNMERLADQGIRFTTFYAQSVSSPSRVSLMTGQNAARHGTTNWIYSESDNRTPYGPSDWNWQGIKSSDITLPSVLREAGYRTIHVGKAHFGPFGSEGEFPQNIGFDVNIGGCSIGHPGSYYGEDGYGNINGQKERAIPDLEEYHGTHTFLTDALTMEAEKEMDKALTDNKPFFLYMAHYAVHSPLMSDDRFAENYKNKKFPSVYGDNRSNEEAFATLIEGMDKSLGDIMDYLRDKGIAENTFIIFMGDNGSDAPIGPMDSIASSAPLRGKKGTRWEGGMRVPFIASWADLSDDSSLQKKWKVKRGGIQTQPGTVNDIFPTILELAGASNPQGHIVDGFSLRRQFTGSIDRGRDNSFLMHFPHEHNNSYFTAYRDGKWKLIYNYNPGSENGPVAELYDLVNDPQESTDISSVNSKICRKMISKMNMELKDMGARMCEQHSK